VSKTYRRGERRIKVHGVRKDPPDLRRLARALIMLAQSEADAKAEHERRKGVKPKPRRERSDSDEAESGDAA